MRNRTWARFVATAALALFGMTSARARDDTPEPAAPLDASAIATLVDRLAHGTGEERDAAHKALGRGGKAVVAPLIAVLKGTDSTAGAWAAEALALVGPDAVDAAEALTVGLGRDGMDWPCANALEALGAPGIPGLLRGLAFERAGSRQAALVSLAKVGPLPQSALAALSKSATAPEEEIRSGAAAAIAKVDAPPSALRNALASLVADASTDVRATVARSLSAATGQEPGAVRLLALLAGDPDEYVRMTATSEIARVPRSDDDAETCLNTLARGVADRTAHVRAAAIEAYAASRLDDERLRAQIASLSDDPDANVRLEGLRMLGLAKIVDDAGRARLERALSDPDSGVRVVASAARARLGIEVERALDFLFGEEGIYHANEWVRNEVVRAAGELGPASAAARKRLEHVRLDRSDEFRKAAEAAIERLDAATKPTKK